MIFAAAALWLTAAAALAQEPAALQPLDFLLGEWRNLDAAQPGAGTGSALFARSLQDRIITRTSYAEFPAAADKPGSRHDDLMIIYAGRDGVKADYYDNEGHVIRYAVHTPAAGEVVFLSAAQPGEPVFRLTYKLASPEILKGEFAVAAPDAPADFKLYLVWETRKVAAK